MKSIKLFTGFVCWVLMYLLLHAQTSNLSPKIGAEAIEAKVVAQDISAKGDGVNPTLITTNWKDMVNIDQSGDLTTQIPICEVKSRTMSFPISISYKSGIKAQQRSTEVGLGWNISFGSITRDYGAFEPDYASTLSEVDMTPASADCNGDGTDDLNSVHLSFCGGEGYPIVPNTQNKHMHQNKLQAAQANQLVPDKYLVNAPMLGGNSFWNNGSAGHSHEFVWSDAVAWKIAFETQVFSIPQEVSRINEFNLTT